ncbi:MAG TPA: hypothetical protein H9958_02750 [Candidatus Limosilactobacillus intestinavium]|nr:hypothetical protein [Candidatus Limosilactobacillus intestinavium]
MTATSNNDEVRRMIILDQGTDTELGIVGLGYSPDNGTHFFVTNTIKGRVFRKRDVETLWPLLKDKIQNVMNGSLSVSWADIQNKPDVALRSEIPDMSYYVTHDQLPAPVDLSGYARIGDIPSLNGYAKLTDIPSLTGLVKEAELDNYVKKGEIPEVDLSGYAKITDLIDYAKKSDIPDTSAFALKSEIPDPIDTSNFATQNAVQSAQSTADNAYKIGRNDADLIKQLSNRVDAIKIPDLSGYAKMSDIPTDVVTHAELANATPKIDASLKYMSKKPSDYTDGIFYEEKYISTMCIDRSSLDSSAQTGTYGLVTTKVMTINGTKYARQQCEVLDSQRPITFLRNGYSNSWSSWEVNTTLAF